MTHKDLPTLALAAIIWLLSTAALPLMCVATFHVAYKMACWITDSVRG